jgi:ATP-binding cassette, subfamily G (WHITE), member 2, SNQ2
VGDEVIRGVSGGEKKRVTLAEAQCVGGTAGMFDGCTKGLDAASALDFVKGLRNFADFQCRSVVASCYQASDAMFEQFDKVVVLADGYTTYFGKFTIIEFFVLTNIL